MNLIQAKPEWGVTLGMGYSGFTTWQDDALADGIEYFERFDHGIPFIHAFHVSGPDEVIEAHIRQGVRRAPLSQYLGRPKCQCFIRVPYAWTPDMGKMIITAAQSHLGDRYGTGLILAEALANSIVGHWLNRHTNDLPDRFMSRLLDRDHREICSELVAMDLKTIPLLQTRGCLRFPANTINPKQLGNDDRVFEPLIWRIA